MLVYWIGGPLAALVLGACLIPLRELTLTANLTFAFIVLTIMAAEFGGRAVGLATAVASALSLDFFLTRPYFRLSIEDKHDVVAFLGLAVCGLVASALGAPRHAGSEDSADFRDGEVRLREMRGHAWTHLRWALVVSVLVWAQALWHPLPAPLAWLAVLAQAFFLALATSFAAVQEQWLRRGAPVGRSARVVIPKPWSDAEDLRSALWFALGVMSLVPWAYVAFGRPAPADVLYGAIACSATVLLLLGLLSALGRPKRPLAGASGGPLDQRPSA